MASFVVFGVVLGGQSSASALENRTGNLGCAGRFGKISIATKSPPTILKAPGDTIYDLFYTQTATDIASVPGGGSWAAYNDGKFSSFSVSCVSYG